MKHRSLLLFILLAFAGVLSLPALAPTQQNDAKSQSEAKDTYVCPMHPEVTSDKPGKCPECGMTLQKQEKAQDKSVYRCPMHPDVTSDKPGKCPKCGMYLERDSEAK